MVIIKITGKAKDVFKVIRLLSILYPHLTIQDLKDRLN